MEFTEKTDLKSTLYFSIIIDSSNSLYIEATGDIIPLFRAIKNSSYNLRPGVFFIFKWWGEGL